MNEAKQPKKRLIGDDYAKVTDEVIFKDDTLLKGFRKHLHEYEVKEPNKSEQAFLNCSYDLYCMRETQRASYKALEWLLDYIKANIKGDELSEQARAKLKPFLDSNKQYLTIANKIKKGLIKCQDQITT